MKKLSTGGLGRLRNCISSIERKGEYDEKNLKLKITLKNVDVRGKVNSCELSSNNHYKSSSKNTRNNNLISV